MLKRRNYSIDNKISNIDFWLKKVEWTYIFNSIPFQKTTLKYNIILNVLLRRMKQEGKKRMGEEW